jgi:hypothetical protein
MRGDRRDEECSLEDDPAGRLEHRRHGLTFAFVMNTGSWNRATVWAAEHGASTPELGGEAEDDGANVGHRFRIHGRLPAASPRPGEYLAKQTEIDLRHVDFGLRNQEIHLSGTVADQGERRQLVALLANLPGVRAVHDRLRVENV